MTTAATPIATATAREADLWARIQAFDLSDPTAAVSFESKLADDCGWTLGRAQAVTFEYRRFLYLTQTAGTPVCPSRDVDHAWHLHLTQTQDYRRFCDAVLGRFLHHEASRGGPAEFARHQAMYDATLEAYAAAFGEAPPPDIWPATAQRFGPAPAPRREPTWNVPPILRDRNSAQLAAFVAAGLLAFLLDRGPEQLPWIGGHTGVFALAYALALVGIVMAFTQYREHRASRIRQVPELDVYETAWLVGGQERALGAAVASLVHRGLLELTPEKKDEKISGGRCRRTARPADLATLHPVERACLAAMPEGDLDFDALRRATADALGAIPRRLHNAGLLVPAGEIGTHRAVFALLLFVLLVVGCSRLGHAFAAREGALFLLTPLAWITAATLALLVKGQERPTLLGRAVLDDLKARHANLKDGKLTEGPGRWPRHLARDLMVTLAFALFGTQAVMADPTYAGINFVFGAGSGNTTGDSGSASGCGGGAAGGDGGGCGGCGGCG
jgi:uncharacterized protein (TIGR04222 family)